MGSSDRTLGSPRYSRSSRGLHPLLGRAGRAAGSTLPGLAGHRRQQVHDGHPLEGYRRLTFMMLDDDVVAVSPSSTYRVLRNAGRLDRRWLAPSKKGTGFVQPLAPHDHWHIDVSTSMSRGLSSIC